VQYLRDAVDGVVVEEGGTAGVPLRDVRMKGDRMFWVGRVRCLRQWKTKDDGTDRLQVPKQRMERMERMGGEDEDLVMG
jgi:hypothetical protein